MDYEEDFNQLSNYLEEAGLNWIVTEVREEISTGKFVEERISTLREDTKSRVSESDIATFRKGQAVDFTKRIDYSAQEKMRLFIHAIKRGVVEPLEIEKGIIGNLGEDIDDVLFASEEGEEELFIDRSRADVPRFTELEGLLNEYLSIMDDNHD